ncbi:MAG: hypothetical protein ACI8RZ_003614 [Myxococcota bacterium]|jgi:hypothetical protein
MRIQNLCLSVFLLTAACSDGKDTGPVEEVQGDCDISITKTWPADGATGVYHRDPIEFTLSEPDSTATLEADFTGTQTISEDGLLISYTPDPPLDPDTTYTVTMSYCFATPQVSFTTSSLGTPLESGVSLGGMTWLQDPSEGEYTQGSGLVANMAAVFDRALLVAVSASDGSSMDWRLGVADEAEELQDECFRTIDVEGIDLSEPPFFQFAETQINVEAFNGELHLYDVLVEGTLSADGTTFGGLHYAITVDLADLVEVMKVADVDTLCELATNLGSDCGPCPSGGADSCTTVEARGLIGEATTASVVEVLKPDEVEGCEEE